MYQRTVKVKLHTPDWIPPGINGYTFDSTADEWPQQTKFTLPGHLFTHLDFPERPCCLECNICSRICHDYGQIVFDQRMTDRFFFPYSFKIN